MYARSQRENLFTSKRRDVPSKANLDPRRAALEEHLDDFTKALDKYRRAVKSRGQIVERLDHLAVRVGLSASLIDIFLAQRLAKLRAKKPDYENPSDRLMRRFGQEAKEAEAGLHETCKKMHSDIIRLSPNVTETKATLDLFDGYTRSPVAKSEDVIELVEKVLQMATLGREGNERLKLIKRVQKLAKEGLDHVKICTGLDLDNTPLPSGCRWKGSTWIEAKKLTPNKAVDEWLSKAIRSRPG
jgi:hypothetical protein